MARVYKEHGYEFREIQSAGNRLRMSFVPELGGVGTSLLCVTSAGIREMLWLHEDFWRTEADKRYGGWPFLFPICGRLERDGVPECYLYKGRRYSMPIHGFASRMPWRVDTEDDQSIRLVLTETPETLRQYPFPFQVELTYTLFDDRLVCEQTYRNTGYEPMPYYAGFHPYFSTPRTDQGKEQSLVDFKPVCRYIYNARLTDITGQAPALTFPISIAEPTINEQLHRMPIGGNHARLIQADNRVITMDVCGTEDKDMFPFIQLFTQKEHPFFCMEPWMGTPNMLNTVEGARWLQPGIKESAVLCVGLDTD